MSEKIPADIMKTAHQITEEFGTWLVLEERQDLIGAISGAIHAERKRCAEAYMHWARKMMEEVEGKGGMTEADFITVTYQNRGEQLRKIMQDAYDNTERRLNETGHAGNLVRPKIVAR